MLPLTLPLPLLALSSLFLLSLPPLALAAAVQLLPRHSSSASSHSEHCTSFLLPSPLPESLNATLDYAEYYPAGALFNETDPNTSLSTTGLEAFCRVRVNITTSATSMSISEVWLPDDFKGVFLGTGNGASGGGFAWSDMGFSGVNNGFASHATNGGHSSNGSSAVFASNPESLIDWGYRSMHQGTVLAKAVVASYYELSPDSDDDGFLSIYGSCSAGGRQGWMEAERYPEDYDAIITGSPAVDDVRQSASALWVNQKVLPVNGSTWFSNETWQMVHEEVLKQCDELDGLKDGIISNPHRCIFRPQSLACRPGSNSSSSPPSCLTFAQLDTLKYIYEPWKDENDTYVYAGFPFGAEGGFITGNLLVDGGAYGQDGDFYRYAVYNDSNWSVDQISYDSVKLGLEGVAYSNSAINPNLTAFVARGGKLIHYVGSNDQYLSMYESIRWHDTVDTYMSTHTNYTTSDYYRLFVVPGMKHCSGGTGANVFGQPNSWQAFPPASLEPSENAIFALIEWVQNGRAPSNFTATSYHDNNSTLGISYQRPICQYPKYPVYKSTAGGDEKNASSFACEL